MLEEASTAIENAGAKASAEATAKAYRASMSKGRVPSKALFAIENAEAKASAEATAKAYRASTQLGQKMTRSLAKKAGTAFGTVAAQTAKVVGSKAGKATIGIAKHLIVEPFKPIAGFIGKSAERKAAYEAASTIGKVVQTGKTVAQGGLAIAKTGGRVGLTIGEGIAIQGAWEGGKEAAKQIEAGQQDIYKKAAHARKYNLEVSAPGFNESMLRAFTGGSPKIKVEEIDKTLRSKRLAQGQAKFEETAGRNVIKGVSK